MLKTRFRLWACTLLDSMKDKWPVTIISLKFLGYFLEGWLFFNNVMLFLVLDLHLFTNFPRTSSNSGVKHVLGFRIFIRDFGGQIVFPARNRSSFMVRFLRCFVLATIWRTKRRKIPFLSFYFMQINQYWLHISFCIDRASIIRYVIHFLSGFTVDHAYETEPYHPINSSWSNSLFSSPPSLGFSPR